ncbi:hypothetical protein ES703_36411 [subsurface metagenome]
MLWLITMWSHKLSITRFVKWWLRMSFLDKLLFIILVNILLFIISMFTVWVWSVVSFIILFFYSLVRAASTSAFESLNGFSNFLSDFTSGAGFGFFIFVSIIFGIILLFYLFLGINSLPAFLIDTIVDIIVTRIHTKKLAMKDSVALTTRTEYIGGHPKLPHGRFVYLLVEGTKKDPLISAYLPGQGGVKFSIPVIDMIKTEGKETDKYEASAGLGIFLTTVSPSVWRGRRIHFNIDYINKGRKQTVEFGPFLRGNEEILSWKNFLVCMQAEADTGETPYGPWRSLPEEEESE